MLLLQYIPSSFIFITFFQVMSCLRHSFTMHSPVAFFFTLLVSISLTVKAAVILKSNDQVLIIPPVCSPLTACQTLSTHQLMNSHRHYDNKKAQADLHSYTPRWDFCVTWKAIWQHADSRIYQMSFVAGGLDPMYIIEFYKDEQCKESVGYTFTKPSTQVAIIPQGKNSIPNLLIVNGQAAPWPSDVARNMQAFKVKFVCANGDFSNTEDHSDCAAKGGTAKGNY